MQTFVPLRKYRHSQMVILSQLLKKAWKNGSHLVRYGASKGTSSMRGKWAI